MSENPEHSPGVNTEPGPPRRLSPEARRALQEAEQRRRERDAGTKPQLPERGGQAGPDPTRYGDWEKGGIASDF